MKPSFSVLDSIPKEASALSRAFKINRVVCSIGFDYDNQEERWKQVEEELLEVKAELGKGEMENLELEIGDLLFSLVSVCAAEGVEAENALHKALHKFERRFRRLEELVKERQVSLNTLSVSELTQLWQLAKISS